MDRSSSDRSTTGHTPQKRQKHVENRDASATNKSRSRDTMMTTTTTTRLIPSSRVESVLGITEQELVKLEPHERKQFLVSKSREDHGQQQQQQCEELLFVNIQTGVQTPIGSFSTPTVGELRRQVLDLPVESSKETASAGGASKRDCKFYALYNCDIGELQTRLHTQDECLVQIAGNFNCLCVPHRKKAPDCGHLVECAHKSKTQGPAATFGPLASTLYLTHFCMTPEYSGQTLQRQINLLDKVAEYAGRPVNGKVTLEGDEQPIGDQDVEINKVADAVRVGLQTDCRILYGRDKQQNNIRLQDSSSIDIDQCHTATINWNSLTAHHTRKHIPRWVPQKRSDLLVLTRTLLRAVYEGIYLAALTRRRRHLYLTLVGGGVFGNPVSIIVEELARAHKQWASHPHSCLEGVYLCAYSEADNVEDLLREKGIEICTDVPTF